MEMQLKISCNKISSASLETYNKKILGNYTNLQIIETDS